MSLNTLNSDFRYVGKKVVGRPETIYFLINPKNKYTDVNAFLNYMYCLCTCRLYDTVCMTITTSIHMTAFVNCSKFPGAHLYLRLKHSKTKNEKRPKQQVLSFIPTQMPTLPFLVCPSLPSLNIYLAIYLNSQFLLHYCLALHLPSLFISAIIKLYFLPLYSSPSHPHFLSLCGVHYRPPLLRSTESPGRGKAG